MKMPIEQIVTDPELQPRVALDTTATNDYLEAIRAGAVMPPLVLFYDGQKYWLADGFHRHYAFTLLGIKEVPVEVRNGNRREALLFSCGANATHGLRRSNDDKRRAVEKLLADDEWQRWSSRSIAKACSVSHTYVEKLREASGNDSTSERMARRGDQVYEHTSRRKRGSHPTGGDQPANGSTEQTDALHLRQENLGRALEIISGIAEQCSAAEFPVSDRMRAHLPPARDWLNALDG